MSQTAGMGLRSWSGLKLALGRGANAEGHGKATGQRQGFGSMDFKKLQEHLGLWRLQELFQTCRLFQTFPFWNTSAMWFPKPLGLHLPRQNTCRYRWPWSAPSPSPGGPLGHYLTSPNGVYVVKLGCMRTSMHGQTKPKEVINVGCIAPHYTVPCYITTMYLYVRRTYNIMHSFNILWYSVTYYDMI